MLQLPAETHEASALQELERWVRASNAIIVAKAEGHRTAFTPRRAFIYSDWDFRVLDLIKNDSSVAAGLGDLVQRRRSIHRSR